VQHYFNALFYQLYLGVIPMQNELNKIADTAKTSLDSFQQLGEINFSIAASLMQQQMDMVGIYLENSTKYLQTLSQTKDLGDLYNSQSKLAEDFTKKVIGNTSVTLDIMADAKSKFTGWFEKNIDTMRTVTQPAA
jgi:phasin family protein